VSRLERVRAPTRSWETGVETLQGRERCDAALRRAGASSPSIAILCRHQEDAARDNLLRPIIAHKPEATWRDVVGGVSDIGVLGNVSACRDAESGSIKEFVSSIASLGSISCSLAFAARSARPAAGLSRSRLVLVVPRASRCGILCATEQRHFARERCALRGCILCDQSMELLVSLGTAGVAGGVESERTAVVSAETACRKTPSYLGPRIADENGRPRARVRRPIACPAHRNRLTAVTALVANNRVGLRM